MMIVQVIFCGWRSEADTVMQVCDTYPDNVAEELKAKFAEAFDQLEEASAVQAGRPVRGHPLHQAEGGHPLHQAEGGP
jgi:hypothetical protein